MSMCEGGRGVVAAVGHCTRPEGQGETTWCPRRGVCDEEKKVMIIPIIRFLERTSGSAPFFLFLHWSSLSLSLCHCSHSFTNPLPPHSTPPLSLSPSLCVSAWTAAQFHTQGKMKHSNHWACSQIKGCAKKKKKKLFEGQCVCVRLPVFACTEVVYMFAALYLCICVLACEIWVCLFRVFFPSVILQPGCCMCVRVCL